MKQKSALEILKSGRNAFLTGAAGTGKTHVLNEYIKWLREEGVPVAVTASTGIAATHLGGQTIHSWSGLGVKDSVNAWDLDALEQKKNIVRSLNGVSVLIIDEISMLSADSLNAVNAILKHIRRSDKAFGGLQVVLSGDFFQLPPVVKGSSFDAFSQFAFNSEAWKEAEFKVLYLDKQYRQNDALAEILNEMRTGELSSSSVKTLKARTLEPENEEEVIKLHTHNVDVDNFNKERLLSVKGRVFSYPASLSGNKAKAEKLLRHILAPELLELKVGARVMFVKNDPLGRFVNGSLGTVSALQSSGPKVLLDSGAELSVDKECWELCNDYGRVLATVEQYPLRLAWAITVHKSQGMSMDKAHMDLSKTFVKGQGYVALSRVRNLQGLFLSALNETALKVERAVIEKDCRFKEESASVERIFENFSGEKKRKLQEEFLSSARKKAKSKSYDESLKLLYLGSVSDIAKERGLKRATVISHLESALDAGENFSIENLRDFEKINLSAIFSQFEKLGDERLSPAHKALKGKVDFDDLRLARIAFRMKEE